MPETRRFFRIGNRRPRSGWNGWVISAHPDGSSGRCAVRDVCGGWTRPRELMTAGGIDRDQAETIAKSLSRANHVTSDQFKFKAGQAEVRAENCRGSAWPLGGTSG